MDRYNIQERIHMLKLSLKESQRNTRNIFHQDYPDRPKPSQSTVSRLIKRFEKTGSVHNLKIPGRPKSATSISHCMDVLASINIDPTQSLRKLSNNIDISKSSLQRILKLHKFHPYKLRLIHELNEDDPDRRIEFCEIMQNKSNDDPNFIKSILFSDESKFYLNGVVNRHNMVYWSEDNPHWCRTIAHQDIQGINVWAGILGDTIIGPYFYDGTLNHNQYLEILQSVVSPYVTSLTDNEEIPVWFQQDGAPAHFHHSVRQYLNVNFPDHWIGRRGTIEWPARSPDLTPLDYFLWGHLKSVVYSSQPHSIDDLKERIHNECQKITSNTFAKIRGEFYNRLGYCLIVNGANFEQLIK